MKGVPLCGLQGFEGITFPPDLPPQFDPEVKLEPDTKRDKNPPQK